MTRNWLLAHWRRLAMQMALCGVLGVCIGLAALVAHQKRLALRLPLGSPITVGRLRVSMPRGWSTPALLEEGGAGDSVAVEEVLPDGVPGRRLMIQRVRTGGLISPIEHLLRSHHLTDAELGGGGAGAAGSDAAPVRVQALEVAGWPGVMITRPSGTAGGRRKRVLACAVMPPAQAVIIRLDGPRPTDEADDELVRQMAENANVLEGAKALAMPPSGGTVEMGGGVFALVPDGFRKLPEDLDRTSRDLLADGSSGSWAAIELIPCLWLAGDGEDAFASLLGARDSEWRSGAIKKLGETMWQADRLDAAGAAGAGAKAFPTRAYCFSNGDDQALLAIMHGGLGDDRLFNSAWKAISTSVRFPPRKDLAMLLKNGAEESRRLGQIGLNRLVPPDDSGRQLWWLWDQTENADKQSWMRLDWWATSSATTTSNTAVADADTVWHGARLTGPDRGLASRFAGAMMGIYDGDSGVERVEQTWEGPGDFSRYMLKTDRVVNGRDTSQRTTTQRWKLVDGQLQDLLKGEAARAAPEQYVPGGWLPLMLGKLSDKPMILRTESFIGCNGSSGGLLTLLVARVSGGSMACVTVTVNGTGQISRWWYAPDGSLRYIDFAGGLRAQRNDVGLAPRGRQ